MAPASISDSSLAFAFATSVIGARSGATAKFKEFDAECEQISLDDAEVDLSSPRYFDRNSDIGHSRVLSHYYGTRIDISLTCLVVGRFI